jgi:hypothetical protein
MEAVIVVVVFILIKVAAVKSTGIISFGLVLKSMPLSFEKSLSWMMIRLGEQQHIVQE